MVLVVLSLIDMALVGGLVAFGAYKMSKRDADRIEEHTGKNPEDMSDQELEQAMNDLQIEKQYFIFFIEKNRTKKRISHVK